MAFAAYDLIGTTANFRAGSYDTSVDLLFCGRNPEATTFDRMLAELDLIVISVGDRLERRVRGIA